MTNTCSDYTVKSGDCLWNIAKAHLKESGTDAPSDKQVAEETDRLAKLNQLDENGRNRDLIYPGEKIRIA